MNSYNTDIFFSNYYNLQSIHFELNRLIDWLKISQIRMQMRSAHSWISITDNISRPVAFDLKSFLKGERALLALVERS